MHKLQKILVILLINFLIGILLFLLIEESTFNIRHQFHTEYWSRKQKEFPKLNRFKLMSRKSYNKKIDKSFNYLIKNGFREPSNLDSKNKSIILFGASFVYGEDIEKNIESNETFSDLLSKSTNRPVYNFAFSGWGPQHTLYLLSNTNILNSVKIPPEYVIYTFIPDHIKRNIFTKNGVALSYILKNKKVERYNPFYISIYNSYVIKELINLWAYTNYFSTNNREKNFDLFLSIMKESQKIIKNKYPNCKFAVLIYKGVNKPDHIFANYPFLNNLLFKCKSVDNWYYETKQWDKLVESGVVVISTDELTKESLMEEKYLAKDNYHPNSKAWQLLIPKLKEKLGL